MTDTTTRQIEDLINQADMIRELIRAYAPSAQRYKPMRGTRTVMTFEDAAEWFAPLATEEDEVFAALYLTAKGDVLAFRVLHRGSSTETLVCPRTVFREACRLNACQIIVAHNHPSGNPEPSPEDLKMTKRLNDCGELLAVGVIDHMVIGNRSAYSTRTHKVHKYRTTRTRKGSRPGPKVGPQGD